MSLIDYDSWLLELESCEKLYQSILSASHENVSKERIRNSILELNAELSDLRQKLETSGHVTQGERERRENLLRLLEEKEKKLFDEHISPKNEDREKLLSHQASYVSSGSTSRGEIRDVGPSGNFGDDFNQILVEQDESLDALHDVIVRQKHLASTIGQEVGTQNELIDDINDGVDRTRERLINTTDNVRQVGRSDKTCYYWVLITVLLIIVIILIIIPRDWVNKS